MAERGCDNTPRAINYPNVERFTPCQVGKRSWVEEESRLSVSNIVYTETLQIHIQRNQGWIEKII